MTQQAAEFLTNAHMGGLNKCSHVFVCACNGRIGRVPISEVVNFRVVW